MAQKQQYSIGELSQLCNVSKKALRFYDKIGLISSLRHDYNNYRMYTHDELLLVPVLKYYKQKGFKLDEMRSFITGQRGSVHQALRQAFEDKLAELHEMQNELSLSEESVRDWLELIKEAEMVLKENVREVSVKYVPAVDLCFQEQPFNGRDIKSAVVNLDFLNYMEKTGNTVTGPLFIQFSDIRKRMEQQEQDIRLMQRVLRPDGISHVGFGGCMMASCYHIGPLEHIRDTYERFVAWLKEHDYDYGQECYERYVTDYWTTSSCSCHVTELLVKIRRK